MKKFLVTLMAVLCVMTCGVAAENKTEDALDVTYSVDVVYTWAIPTSIDFAAGAIEDVTPNGNNGKVTVSKNVIPSGQELAITIADGQVFKIKNEGNHELTYAVKAAGSELSAGSDVLVVAAGTNVGEVALTATLSTEGVEQAGNYSGTLGFAAEVRNAN